MRALLEAEAEYAQAARFDSEKTVEIPLNRIRAGVLTAEGSADAGDSPAGPHAEDDPTLAAPPLHEIAVLGDRRHLIPLGLLLLAALVALGLLAHANAW